MKLEWHQKMGLVFQIVLEKKQSRATTGRTTRCCCKFWYVSNFTI